VKRLAIMLALIIFALNLSGCKTVSDQSFDIGSISSYRDISTVTEQDIAAVEALKNSRDKFVYGQLLETEAFRLSDGSYAGFAARFCELLSDLFGIEFSLSIYNDFGEMVSNGLDKYVVDFTGDLTPTPARMQQYYMTHPIAERSLRIFSHEGGQAFYNEKDVNGLKIGSLAGTIDIGHVIEAYPHLAFTVVEVDSFESAADKMKSGDIDAFITEGVLDPTFDEFGGIVSKEFFPMVYTPVSMTTANPDLKPIIDVVNKYIEAGGIDLLYDYYKEGNNDYSRYKLEKSFTDSEMAYYNELKKTGAVVKVALEQDNYPICFFNTADKEFQGIAVDVLSEISMLTGIVFETANDEFTPWEDIYRMLQSGEVSLVSQLLYSEDREGVFLWADKPYATAFYALLSKSDYPDLASYQVVSSTVGTVSMSAFEEQYYAWFPENDNLLLYSTLNETLDALESGEIDLMMGSDSMLLMQQNYREKQGYKVNIRFGIPLDSYFGFNLKEKQLCAIISKAQLFTHSVDVTEEWASRGFDYAKKMAEQRSQYFMLITIALFLVLVFAAFLLLKNRKLSSNLDNLVKKRTAELEQVSSDSQATAAKLAAVISNYPGVVWNVGTDEVVTLFDGLYLKEIGVTHDFIEGKSLDLARKKNRHLDIIENVNKTMAEGPQSWISDIDGKMFRTRTSAIFDSDGAVTGVVGNTEDITETLILQHELEAALEKAAIAVSDLELAQQTMSTIFESNPHINILFDKNFKIIDCNPIAVKFMGFDTKEEMLEGFAERLTGSIPPTLSGGRQTRPINDWVMHAIKEGHVKLETEFVLGDSTRSVDIELRRIPYQDSFAIVGYILDMTEVHEREMELILRDRQLQEAVKEAEAANKAKSAFLSTMSHEIRTPMNAILGITEIQLQNESLDPVIMEAFGKIYISGDLLLGIINDILDLSKIEAGKLELMTSDYEIASLISDTAQLNMMRIGSKPIEFELNIDENIPSQLSGDELRVKQILNNLLSNAFKYTDEGTVVLSVSVKETGDAGKVILEFVISDTGQGMTEEQISELFDEYSRFNKEANRTTEGTGLGMSITRNLIRLMDGDIEIESQPGAGSTFTICLPQGVAGSSVLGKELAENLRQFRSSSRSQMRRVQITRDLMPYGSVLIVDDVETNIYVARGVMTPYGLKIDSADSGYEAIEKIKSGKVYDIVFMDHMMPGMDGIEATKIIREMGYEHPIVALTANAVAGQADIFLGNGFDEFISKPIDIRQLNTVLNKLIRDKQPPEVLEAARQQAEERNETVSEKSAEQEPEKEIAHRFAEIFVRDACKSLAVLDSIMEKDGPLGEDDVRTYVIHIHGLKSALANIGQMELSAAALKLEITGREGNCEAISTETPAFLVSLRTLVDRLIPKEENQGDEPATEDRVLLKGKLLAVKEASQAYSKKDAKELMTELKDKKWQKSTKEFLDTVSEQLLHSDFDEVVSAIDKFILTLNG